MSQNPPLDDAYKEKLLAVAAEWRKRAGGMTDPYHGDVLCRAAEAVERTAARVKNQAPATPEGLRLSQFH